MNAKKLFSKYNEEHRSLNSNIQTNPNKFRNFSISKTERLLNDYSRYVRLQYIMGALHPKLAFENKWDVRYPSILPVPTACVRVMATHNLTSGSAGQLYINYAPGTLIASNASVFEASGITVNTTCNGAGTAGTNSFVQQPFFTVPQLWDRYRLVGAEIIGTYTGNVFNRQGAVFGGVHYEPSVIATKGVSGAGTIAGLSNANVDRFSSNLGLVKNQLWAETKNISEGQTSISYIWTPDSAVNQLYAGYIPTSISDGIVLNSTVAYNTGNTSGANVRVNLGINNTTGPDRQINFFYQGLPVSNQCIRIDIYELYEYIPDVAALNVVSVSSVKMTTEDALQVNTINPVSFDIPNVKTMQDVLDKPDVHSKKDTMLSKMGSMIEKVAPTLVDKAVQMAISFI